MGWPEGWKATGSSTLPSSVLEALPVLHKTEEQRPLRSPTVSFILNPFRHCFGSERSSGRGVLFSPAGPLFVQRPLFIPAAVRRVWILKGKVCGRQVIHSCLHTFIHSFIHSFIHLLNHSLTQSFVNLLLSLIHSLNHPFMHLIHSFTYSLMHSFLPIIHSLMHAFSN